MLVTNSHYISEVIPTPSYPGIIDDGDPDQPCNVLPRLPPLDIRDDHEDGAMTPKNTVQCSRDNLSSGQELKKGMATRNLFTEA